MRVVLFFVFRFLKLSTPLFVFQSAFSQIFESQSEPLDLLSRFKITNEFSAMIDFNSKHVFHQTLLQPRAPEKKRKKKLLKGARSSPFQLRLVNN